MRCDAMGSSLVIEPRHPWRSEVAQSGGWDDEAVPSDQVALFGKLDHRGLVVFAGLHDQHQFRRDPVLGDHQVVLIECDIVGLAGGLVDLAPVAAHVALHIGQGIDETSAGQPMHLLAQLQRGRCEQGLLVRRGPLERIGEHGVSRSVNSRWSVLSLWVSPLTTSTRPVLERTTPEIAPAARARARCQWDKARAGGRSDCCAAPRCVSSDGQRPCSRPTSSANCSGSIVTRKKCSGSAGLAGTMYGRNGQTLGSSPGSTSPSPTCSSRLRTALTPSGACSRCRTLRPKITTCLNCVSTAR